ncbi:hypothetical protein [Cerasicoccus frondis]|uniref:hypothetical protein n=1 Tax=Cerasicoccus frondis TaxID=490090 RepID=UPI0028525CFC|nr:hypothetical protein [Cerasicoccus frondis]
MAVVWLYLLLLSVSYGLLQPPPADRFLVSLSTYARTYKNLESVSVHEGMQSILDASKELDASWSVYEPILRKSDPQKADALDARVAMLLFGNIAVLYDPEVSDDENLFSRAEVRKAYERIPTEYLRQLETELRRNYPDVNLTWGDRWIFPISEPLLLADAISYTLLDAVELHTGVRIPQDDSGADRSTRQDLEK